MQDSDYPRLAKWILARFDMPEEGPLDVNLLAERMEMKLLSGRFPENSVTGEIFFNYGRAEILDPAIHVIHSHYECLLLVYWRSWQTASLSYQDFLFTAIGFSEPLA